MVKKDIWLLGLLFGLGLAATDVYVSILPKLVNLYDVSLHHMNLTLTIYFIMTALGTLSYLNLSNIFSAKKINLISMIFFFFGTLVISTDTHYGFILIGRAIQGFGFGLIQNNVTNSIRQYDPRNFAKNISITVQASEILCFISPLLGVYLFEEAAWNSPFMFIIVMAFFLFFITKKIFKKDIPINLNSYAGNFRSNLNAILHQNFGVYLVICILLNATIWGLISISPYYLVGKSFSDGFHAFFYTVFTAFYISGSYCFEKISSYDRDKIQTYTIGLMSSSGVGIIASTIIDSQYAFMLFLCIFGFLAGLLYGFVLERSQENISEKNEDARKLATTILLLSRLIGSGILTAFLSWLFHIDQEASIIFGGTLIIFISYLLFLGRRNFNYALYVR